MKRNRKVNRNIFFGYDHYRRGIAWRLSLGSYIGNSIGLLLSYPRWNMIENAKF